MIPPPRKKTSYAASRRHRRVWFRVSTPYSGSSGLVDSFFFYSRPLTEFHDLREFVAIQPHASAWGYCGFPCKPQADAWG